MVINYNFCGGAICECLYGTLNSIREVIIILMTPEFKLYTSRFKVVYFLKLLLNEYDDGILAQTNIVRDCRRVTLLWSTYRITLMHKPVVL